MRSFLDRGVWIFCFFLPFLNGGCTEPASTGVFVTIPQVSITCTTANCRQGRPARAFVVYTTSSCASSQFGETVAGSVNLSCNGTGCSGTVTNFTGTAGLSESSIREGYYSVCAVLDFNSDYVGTATLGDTTGGLANTRIAIDTTIRSLIAFVDL